MKRTSLPIALGAIALFAFGCSDLLEEDLTGFGVVLVAPPDGYSTTSNLVTFRWEAVPHALNYRIQIATPDFANPVLYLHDSLTSSATFTTALDPGDYQWRVRAENPNSNTSYYQRNLVVGEAATLEGLTPILSGPGSGTVISDDPITFTWQALSGADDYRFELRTGSQAGELVNAQIVSGTTLTLSDIAEGSYAWGIQAQNTTSTSDYSYRILTVDRTAPSAPVLTAPAEAALLPNAPFTLQWQSGTNAGNGSADSVFVLDNAQQQVRALPSLSQSYTDSLGTGMYSWYVRTTDAAGNGTPSATRTFSVQ